MKTKKEEFIFAFDHKTDNWFVINKSDKYKFYGKIFKKRHDVEWFNNFKKTKIDN